MKNFKQKTAIKNITYADPFYLGDFELKITYLDGTQDTCYQSAKDIADSLTGCSLYHGTLILDSDKKEEKIYLNLIGFELLENTNPIPHYRIIMSDRWHILTGREDKSAKEIFDTLALVHINEEGFLILDNTQKRTVKNITAIDVDYKNDNLNVKVCYDDQSSRETMPIDDDYILAKYTGFFRNSNGQLESDGTLPTKIAKPKQDIKTIDVNWLSCTHGIPSRYETTITYADGSKQNRQLTSHSIRKKYGEFFNNIDSDEPDLENDCGNRPSPNKRQY